MTVNRAELQSIERTAESIDTRAERAIDNLPSHSSKKRRRPRPDRSPRSGKLASRAVPSGAKDLAQPSESIRKSDTRPESSAQNYFCSDLYLPPDSSEAGENKKRQVADMPGKTRSPAAASQSRNRPTETESDPGPRENGATRLLPSKGKIIPDASQRKGEQTSPSESNNVTEHVVAFDRVIRSLGDIYDRGAQVPSRSSLG